VRLVLFSLAEQPREALHEASAGRDAEQDSPVHLLARRELCEPLGDGVLGHDHLDLGISRSLVFVWHAGGMQEDGRPTVSRSRATVQGPLPGKGD
jgi:hypothetical protein